MLNFILTTIPIKTDGYWISSEMVLKVMLSLLVKEAHIIIIYYPDMVDIKSDHFVYLTFHKTIRFLNVM